MNNPDKEFAAKVEKLMDDLNEAMTPTAEELPGLATAVAYAARVMESYYDIIRQEPQMAFSSGFKHLATARDLFASVKVTMEQAIAIHEAGGWQNYVIREQEQQRQRQDEAVARLFVDALNRGALKEAVEGSPFAKPQA